MVLSTFDEREQSIQQEFGGRKVPGQRIIPQDAEPPEVLRPKALLHSLDEHDRSSLGH